MLRWWSAHPGGNCTYARLVPPVRSPVLGARTRRQATLSSTRSMSASSNTGCCPWPVAPRRGADRRAVEFVDDDGEWLVEDEVDG